MLFKGTKKDKEAANAMLLSADSEAEVLRALKLGADIEAKNEREKTALMVATECCDGDLVVVLSKLGADLNTSDMRGNTALMYAVVAVERLFEIRRIFLEADGVDLDATNKDGCTALMWAAWNGQLDSVSMLLDKGADINLRDLKGTTALMYATSLGYSDIVRVLLERGADTKINNNDGKTALELTDNPDVLAEFDRHSERINTKHEQNSALEKKEQINQIIEDLEKDLKE
ncbi:MAG: ankyrin repeat domain-containing protein [Candidatus Micrarchaeota archaeon]|nr:ankyrin repeat domain-containing protein [Candidatus Micrarchaeota archaeon]